MAVVMMMLSAREGLNDDDDDEEDVIGEDEYVLPRCPSPFVHLLFSTTSVDHSILRGSWFTLTPFVINPGPSSSP